MANHNIDRRHMLGVLGSSAALIVAGFDPIGRRWISEVAATGCPSFADVPPLDGVLLLDAAARDSVSTDKGNIVSHTPCAVLRPGSGRDIQRMIRYCRRYNIEVAVRGQAHTTHGQALSSGLVIENGSLNRIHSLGRHGADVDAGVRWKDLLIAAGARGLTPPVLTGYTNLSVGGTLSVGGVSGRNYAGAQVDHVRELEVVTGEGHVRRCSRHEQEDLFYAVLAGLGQCGVITRVKMDLVRARPMTRIYNPVYFDTATFFRDLRTLINRGELNEIYNLWVPGPSPSGFLAVMQLAAYYDPSDPPDDAWLLRDLSMPPEAVPQRDSTYLDWILGVDVLIDSWRTSFQWDRLIKPWFDVWLPEETVEPYVTGVLPTLDPARDVGPMGFMLLLPLRRSTLTCPLLRVPHRPEGDWIYLFDILTVSNTPGPDPAFVAEMLDRNRRLFDRARDVGATRYPIGALGVTRQDWARHYGPMWRQFVKWKQRFDPDNILSPGSGIFSDLQQ
jgi:FAD/FMN-containing dehydrogenase